MCCGLGATIFFASIGCGPPPVVEAKVQTTLSAKDGYAECPAGTTVVGGGHELEDSVQMPGRFPVVVRNHPYNNGWRVVCTDDKGIPTPGCKAWVVCASVLK